MVDVVTFNKLTFKFVARRMCKKVYAHIYSFQSSFLYYSEGFIHFLFSFPGSFIDLWFAVNQEDF